MPVGGIHSCKGTNFNGYAEFNGFVELLKWISGLLRSARVVLNAPVYNPFVDKGSQWAVFISTHDVAGDYEGPLVKSNLESVVFQQQEKVSSLILCSSSRS